MLCRDMTMCDVLLSQCDYLAGFAPPWRLRRNQKFLLRRDISAGQRPMA
jgi:hypothetical protein